VNIACAIFIVFAQIQDEAHILQKEYSELILNEQNVMLRCVTGTERCCCQNVGEISVE
jgi:hypothetical protein